MDCKQDDKLRVLLEKYFEAATSLEEEAFLKEYFSTQQDLPSDLLYARQWFAYLDQASRQVSSMPTILGSIPTPRIQAGSVSPDKHSSKTKRVRLWLWPVLSFAAALTAMIILVQPGRPSQDLIYGYVNGVPLTDSRLALAESQKALNTMGRQISKPVRYLNELDQLDNSLNKSLAYLSKLENVHP